MKKSRNQGEYFGHRDTSPLDSPVHPTKKRPEYLAAYEWWDGEGIHSENSALLG